MILEDLEKTIRLVGYRYQPDLHGRHVNNIYKGVATVTSKRKNHGSPSIEELDKKLATKLLVMNSPKNRRKYELMIKNKASFIFRKSLDEAWTESHKEISWAFVLYTFRGALDRLARLFDSRETIGVGAGIQYPVCFVKNPVSDRPANLRGQKPTEGQIKDLERKRKLWAESHKQLTILCTHMYEVLYSLEACERGIMYWRRFGGKINDIIFIQNVVRYLKDNCSHIIEQCPKKKQNIKHINTRKELHICTVLDRMRSGDFNKVILRLLKSRTRLSETRASYLSQVSETNKLLELL